MAGGFSLLGGVCNPQSLGAITTTSLGTTITPGATNTKGSWVQLSAATTYDCVLVDVEITTISSGGLYTMSVDIGIGAGGSERVLIPDIVIPSRSSSQTTISRVLVPLSIPAGTRIAARVGGPTGVNAQVILTLYDGDFTVDGASGVDSIGFVPGSGAWFGTALTPSATINTMGSYSQLVASTAANYVGLFGQVDFQNNDTNGTNYLYTIAIGSVGNEVDIIPYRSFAFQNAYLQGSIPFLPISIPAGTRISARCQVTATPANPIGLTLYGVYQ